MTDMPDLILTNIDDATLAKLRLRAARHGCTVEAEAEAILRAASGGPASAPSDLLASIRRRVEAVGGIDDLELPPRSPAREPIPLATLRKRASGADVTEALCILDGAPDVPPETGDERP